MYKQSIAQTYNRIECLKIETGLKNASYLMFVNIAKLLVQIYSLVDLSNGNGIGIVNGIGIRNSEGHFKTS